MEKFDVVKPHPGNLEASLIVKGKEEAAHAYIQYMQYYIHGKKPLRMPVQIPAPDEGQAGPWHLA